MYNRELISKQKIIIFDGIPGGGKSLLGSLLSAVPKIDQYVLNDNIDQTAALYNLKKIDLDTAVYLLRTNHNTFFYDNALFRTTNFRKSDLTSITKHPRYNSLKKRMGSNDKKVFKQFEKKIVLQYCTHLTGNFSKPYFAAFQQNLIFIKLLRSPSNLEMIKHLAEWTIKWEKNNCRDGYIKFYKKNLKKNYPHFMRNKIKEYFKANKYERAILIMEWFYGKKEFKDFSLQKKYGSKIIVIPYENLITKPFKYFKTISKLIKSKLDYIFFSHLHKEKIPRKINLAFDEKKAINFLRNKIREKYLLKILKLNILYNKEVLKKF